MKLFEFEQRTSFPSVTGLHGLGSYAAAYWHAAKGMIDNKLFNSHGQPDFSTFPIAFLFRHALELMLKAILIEHDERYSEDPQSLLDRNHKLKGKGSNGFDYLMDLRSVVSKAGVFEDGEPVVSITQEQWDCLQAVLDEWEKYDPDGFAFRYSIDKKAKKDLTHPDFTFDIGQFSQVMEEALEILASLKSELDQLRYQDVLKSEGV
jgi:hypothetical protein